MTTYVFDTNVFINLFRHYYQDRFPNLWNRFNTMIDDHTITSTREVLLELESVDDAVSAWAKKHRGTVFPMPAHNEIEFVTKIFLQPNFQKLINTQNRLKGTPSADPFVIARAQCLEKGCVVTQEVYKEDGAKIPNVCKHFQIECTNFEGFMEKEGWTF